MRASRQRETQGSDRPMPVFRRVDWLAWSMLVLTLLLVGAGALLALISRSDDGGPELVGVRNVLLTSPFVLGNAVVGALIALRRSSNPLGWLMATCGLLVALDGFARTYAIQGMFIQPSSLPAVELVAWFNAWTWQLTFALMLVIIPLIFPTGRPPSPSWRPLLWLGIGFAVAWTLSAAFRPGTIYLDWRSDYSVTNPLAVTFLSGWWLILSDERAGPPVALAAAIGAGALIKRLVQARGEERQQLKWIVFAGAVSAAGAILVAATGAWTGGFALVALGLTALPIAAGIAILRSRLFDIDVIISNTLTYAMLTAFVAGLYGGVTTLVQRLSVLVTGQQSDSTLVIAAIVAAITFTPVKNSLQALVDRRFKSANVPKSNAATARSLAELSAEVARLRARVDRLQATSR